MVKKNYKVFVQMKKRVWEQPCAKLRSLEFEVRQNLGSFECGIALGDNQKLFFNAFVGRGAQGEGASLRDQTVVN
jgi:hypothetical protein